MDLHPIRPASKAFNRQCNLSQWIYTQFDQSDAFNRQCNLNGFTPNPTGQMPLTSNVISMDLNPIRLVKFNWALITGQIG